MDLIDEITKNRIAQAMEKLVSTRFEGESAIVSLPISYPSGSLSAVSISINDENCFISDCAIGYREAEMSGAADFYDAAARHVSAWFGVGYDGASVFAASAHIDRVAGAAIAVANASAGAVSRAVMKAAEAKERNRNSAVFEILSDVFGRTNVEKTARITGRDAEWDAHNVVCVRGRRSVFEYVSSSPTSVAFKFQMFSDIVKIEDPPALVSVVDSVEKLGRKGAMLSDVSDIIEVKSARSVYERYGRAA
jgi:hypothetical protein